MEKTMRKVVVLPCSGIGKAYGALARETAHELAECVRPEVIPLIVGFIDQQGRISTRRAFTTSLLFAVGILITIGVIGAITAAAGRMMGDLGSLGKLCGGRHLFCRRALLA